MSTFDSDLVRPSENTHPEDGPSQNLLSEFIEKTVFSMISVLLKYFVYHNTAAILMSAIVTTWLISYGWLGNYQVFPGNGDHGTVCPFSGPN